MDVLASVLTIATGLIAVPVAVFFIEVIAATTLGRRFITSAREIRGVLRPRITVLIPAHNESVGIAATLDDITRQLQPDDQLFVVADNCTDDTASIASVHGARVIESHDPTKRGKGYALDFGIRYLAQDPHDVLIMVDADCRLARNSICELAMTCAATCRPVQALYLMTAPPGSAIKLQVAEFAWRVKNWLRPLGLKALGLPCQLMGTGMAFPWDVIRRVDLASDCLVEDLKLGIDLASQGRYPLFCPTARVTSQFGASANAVQTQRERWEREHLKMILNSVPRLIWTAIVARDWRAIALALDLAVPPLSLLAVVVAAMLVFASLSALLGLSSIAFSISAATFLAFLAASSLAWLVVGRDLVPVGTLFSVARYVAGKFGLYRTILFKKAPTAWIRTERDNAPIAVDETSVAIADTAQPAEETRVDETAPT
jgi:cellulose synthase/poly-beta-1,6-N-acetylglucosamine synthase-like glycosyltransferase